LAVPAAFSRHFIQLPPIALIALFGLFALFGLSHSLPPLTPTGSDLVSPRFSMNLVFCSPA